MRVLMHKQICIAKESLHLQANVCSLPCFGMKTMPVWMCKQTCQTLVDDAVMNSCPYLSRTSLPPDHKNESAKCTFVPPDYKFFKNDIWFTLLHVKTTARGVRRGTATGSWAAQGVAYEEGGILLRGLRSYGLVCCSRRWVWQGRDSAERYLLLSTLSSGFKDSAKISSHHWFCSCLSFPKDSLLKQTVQNFAQIKCVLITIVFKNSADRFCLWKRYAVIDQKTKKIHLWAQMPLRECREEACSPR